MRTTLVTGFTGEIVLENRVQDIVTDVHARMSVLGKDFTPLF